MIIGCVSEVRNSSFFIGALTVGIVIVGGIAWWLGPNLLHLALLNTQREEPFTVLSLARGAEPQVYSSRFRMPLAALVASEGGVLVDDYRLRHQFTGERRHTWDYFTRLQMQQARDIVQVATGSPYRLMQQQVPGLQQRLLGSFETAEPNWRQVALIWFLRNFETATTGPDDPMAPVFEQLPSGSGRLVWDAPITAIDEDASWHRLVVVDFEREAEALAWVRSVDVAAARALTNARVRKLALGIFVRESIQPSS